MLDAITLEQRLISLEQAVFDLQYKLENKLEISQPITDNWLERIVGSISDDEAFLKALEYGRTFRQSDKPSDKPIVDTGK